MRQSWLFLWIIIGACAGPQSDIDKLKINDLNENTVEWEQYRGKRVFVNFWATWCKPCIQEMPTIDKAKTQLAAEPVVFLFASNEELDLIQGFRERRGFDFQYVQAQNMEALNIQALPTTFIYDENGKLVFSEAGYRDWSTEDNMALITGKNRK